MGEEDPVWGKLNEVDCTYVDTYSQTLWTSYMTYLLHIITCHEAHSSIGSTR